MNTGDAVKWAFESDWGTDWGKDCQAMVQLAEEVNRLFQLNVSTQKHADDLLEKLHKVEKERDFERSTNNFDATRLRRLATLVGRSTPESDETLLACAGTVIGGIALSVEKTYKDFAIVQEGPPLTYGGARQVQGSAGEDKE